MSEGSPPSPSSLVIFPPRRGRPPADAPTQPVSTRLPEPLYDELTKLARAHDLTLSGVLREVVVVYLHRRR